MKLASIIVAAVTLACVPAFAQSPAPAPKDRSAYLLEALESQRNDALAKLALCYADGNDQIAKLNAQLTALKFELDAERKKSAPAEPPSTPGK